MRSKQVIKCAECGALGHVMAECPKLNLKRLRELVTGQIPSKPRVEVKYDFKIEPEDDVPVRGNALASGDDSADAAAEEWILSRLNSGDVLAWCCVTVTAEVTIGADTFRGNAYLGACSYEKEEDLRRDVFEHYDLKKEALADLKIQLEGAAKRGALASQILMEIA